MSIRIGLDLYGGDNAPDVNVLGAIFALRNYNLTDCELVIIGKDEKAIQKIKESGLNNISFIEAENIVDNNTKPTEVLKMKTSSIYIGCEMLKKGEIGGFVSAGNTGALLASGTFVAGRLEGIKRPALAIPMPGKNNSVKVLIDGGANAEIKPEFLKDFAREGIAFAKFLGKENPRVALLNIGSEEEKGSTLVKEGNEILKNENINYTGYVEGRDLFEDSYDVILTDGFTGNIVLKTMEGTAYYILGELKKAIKSGGILTKLGALLIKKPLYSLKSKLDYRQYGGTFFLGVNGILVKAHGSSDEEAIANAIRVTYDAVKEDLLGKIKI